MEVRDRIERPAVTRRREVASAERDERGLDRLVGVPFGVGEPGQHAVGRGRQQLALVRTQIAFVQRGVEPARGNRVSAKA